MVTKTFFGQDKEGRDVHCYTISDRELTVEILDRGATIRSIIFEGTDVALGYDDVAGYENNDGYLGATIGRYGNRICGGKFNMYGTEYSLNRNERDVSHLHGGCVGYDKLMWKERMLEENGVTLSLTDVGEAAGYPGTLEVEVRFFLEYNTLNIEYQAVGNHDTPINLTNHTYFNLGGVGSGDILDTRLHMLCGRYLPVNSDLIPTGEMRRVLGTAFDFASEAKAIGKDIAADDEQLKYGGGYDHNFCLDGKGFRCACKAVSPKTNIAMTCYTDQPGIQLYTGNVLKTDAGKAEYGCENGYDQHGAFCLETQHYPDSPNQLNFPLTILYAGQRYEAHTAYAFEKESE